MDIGSIGEFVGAMGVIATLVYLALQIRHNTHSTRAMTFSSLATAWQEMFQGFDPAAYDLLIRALVDDPRQFPDEQIKRLIERGAVIGGALDAWMLVPGWIRSATRSRISDASRPAARIFSISAGVQVLMPFLCFFVFLRLRFIEVRGCTVPVLG